MDERKTGRTHAAYGAFNRAKTHCPRGHEYTPENTYAKENASGRTGRHCRTCRKTKDHDRYQKTRGRN